MTLRYGIGIGIGVAATVVVWVTAAAQDRAADVTERRVIAERSKGDNWLVGGRTFDEQHFSPLRADHPPEHSHLGLAWATDLASRAAIRGAA
jgi:quinohemoprotein ethanol dehydrogenase